MKRKLTIISSLLFAIALSSCDIYSLLSQYEQKSESISESIESSKTFSSSSDKSSSSSSSHRIRSSTDSSSQPRSSSSSSSSSKSSSSVKEGEGYYKVDDLTQKGDYRDVSLCQGLDAIPSSGDINLLVIPVEFNNYSFDSNFLTDLDHALNGNGKTDTGYWESLSSFYEKSSNGKVHLTYTIGDIYETNQTPAEFYSAAKKSDYQSQGYDSFEAYATNSLATKVVNNYKKTDSTKQYDSDGNGYIDGLIMVYSCPESYNGNPFKPNTNQDKGNLFWAYCYWDFESNANKTSPNPYTYFWMSVDFLYEAVSSPKVDAHTLIHESGHMFGLDDYYGYDGNYVAGTMSMMDYNILDLDGFSKVSLGWSSAYVVEDSCTIELKPMQSDYECIIVAPSNNGTTSFNGTPFDEYLLLELYTPDGLNYLDSHTAYSSRSKGFTTSGVRLWHVDARLIKEQATSSGYGGSYSYTSYLNVNDNSNYYFIGASNTYKTDYVDEDFNLLSLIGADGVKFTNESPESTNASLFTTGKSFTMSKYSKFFPNSTKLNNGKSFNFTINFDSVSSSGATITFTRN